MLFWGKFLGNCFDCSSLSWGDETRSKAVPYFSWFFFFPFFLFLSPYFSFCVCIYLWETKLNQSLCLTCLLVCLFLCFACLIKGCFSFFPFYSRFCSSFFSMIKDSVLLFLLLFCIIKQHLGTLPDLLLSRPFLLRCYILLFKHGKLQTQNKIFPFLVKKVVTQVLKPLPTQAA